MSDSSDKVSGKYFKKGSQSEPQQDPGIAPKPILELDPDCAAAWFYKGNGLHSMGRFEEALDCFEKALALDPHNAAVWTNKGVSLTKLGRNKEAMYCCDKALELDPRNAGAWFCLLYTSPSPRDRTRSRMPSS